MIWNTLRSSFSSDLTDQHSRDHISVRHFCQITGILWQMIGWRELFSWESRWIQQQQEFWWKNESDQMRTDKKPHKDLCQCLDWWHDWLQMVAVSDSSLRTENVHLYVVPKGWSHNILITPWWWASEQVINSSLSVILGWTSVPFIYYISKFYRKMVSVILGHFFCQADICTSDHFSQQFGFDY